MKIESSQKPCPSATLSQRRVSVLLICSSYPPVIGGSEIEAQRVSSALIERGNRVLVLCAGGPPMPPVRDWVDPVGVPVRILTRTVRGRTRDIVFALRVAWSMWKERRNYEIVYFLMQGLHLAAGLPVARVLQKPAIMKFGGSGVIPMMRRSYAGRTELDWLQKWSARVMVLNPGMVEEAIEDGFSLEQITWMPNPVDTNQFRPGEPAEIAVLRHKYRIPEHAAVAIYVGRLSHEKGLPQLLSGFARAARSVPHAMLVLLGDGPMRKDLESMAAQLGLTSEKIRFSGRVEASEVPDWLRSADVFALVSPSEGFSCALAEAMSVGLPAVVTDIPANTQLVDNDVHGIVAPVGDELATAGALVRLLNDEQLRKRMGSAARRRIVDNYSTDNVLNRYEGLFAEIL